MSGSRIVVTATGYGFTHRDGVQVVPMATLDPESKRSIAAARAWSQRRLSHRRDAANDVRKPLRLSHSADRDTLEFPRGH